MKDPKPEPVATGKGGGKHPDLEDNKREDGKKRKKEDKKCYLIKNESPHKEICLLPNKTWAINFANKHVNKDPSGPTNASCAPDGFSKNIASAIANIKMLASQRPKSHRTNWPV
jgi:hypothetical protein